MGCRVRLAPTSDMASRLGEQMWDVVSGCARLRTRHPISTSYSGMRRPGSGCSGHGAPFSTRFLGHGVRPVPVPDTASGAAHPTFGPHAWQPAFPLSQPYRQPFAHMPQQPRMLDGLPSFPSAPTQPRPHGSTKSALIRLDVCFGVCLPVLPSSRPHGSARHQSSTSFSHDGSGLCLTPATCSMCSSTPGVRTSRIVKRTSGCP